MKTEPLCIKLCGFGGQGIVLAGVLLGTAAVQKAGLNAVQTQSYGSEARGGECQAEVIISSRPIDSPLADDCDILVSLSQAALDKYLPILRRDGVLIYDPEFVREPPAKPQPGKGPNRTAAYAVPATAIAGDIGVALAANMVMLGFLQRITGLFSADDLLEAISDGVPARYKDPNLKAARAGMDLAVKRMNETEA